MSESKKKQGASRKDLGAWYTHPVLCRFLVQRTLGWLVRNREVSELLDLTICDPTAGKGAFLQAAFDFLDECLTRFQATAGSPMPHALRSPSAWQQHLRERVLHGVDIDVDVVRSTRRQLGIPAGHLCHGDALLPSPHRFSWETSFSAIFRRPNPGFDVILGNPPWNNLRPDDREFFARYDPGFRSLAGRVRRDLRKQHLLMRGDVAKEYQAYLAQFNMWNEYIRKGGVYQHQAAPHGIRHFKIEHNVYKLALELAWSLTREGGMIGMIVPAGFLGDLGATRLRQLYFDSCACRGLWTFREDAGQFDASQAFTLLVFEKQGRRAPFPCVGGLRSLDDLLKRQRTGLITGKLIRTIAADTYAVPELDSAHELAILKKLHRHPPLSDLSPQHPWRARPARDLHTRDDRDLICERNTGLPLLKGEDIEPFALLPTRRWVDPAGYACRGKDSATSRVAWRAIANVHLERRLCATLIPRRHALLNSLNYFIPEQDRDVKHYLVGLLNSLVLEWRLRQLAKNNNVNQYVIASLPVPRLRSGDRRFDRIVSLSRHALATKGKNIQIRAQLDAHVAELYGLTVAEVSVMLQRFPRVPDSVKESVMNELRLDRTRGAIRQH